MKPPTANVQHRRVTQSLQHRLGAIALCAVGSLALGACGMAAASSTTASTTAKAATSAAATITISNFAYSPATLTVTPGETVKVKNADTATHSVTANANANGNPPAFNSGNINPGSSGSFRAPMTPGIYNYTCDIHSFMHGILIVSKK